MDNTNAGGLVAVQTVGDPSKLSLSGMELFPQLEILTDSLMQSQYEAAKLFEIAYYSISNFPQLAKEVCLSAHQARTSQEFAAALMKKFAVTGNQIVNTVIPLILKTVDIGEEDVIKAYFAMIIEWSEDMKNEAEETRDKYTQLTRKLQQDIGLIRQTRKDNMEEKEDLALKREHEEGLKEVEEETLKKWEEEEKQNVKELEELKATRNTITQELHEGTNNGKTYMALALVPEIGLVLCGVGLIVDSVNYYKKMKIYNKIQESLNVAGENRFKIIKEQMVAKRAAQERLHTIQQLYLKDELLGDESSLMEAVLRLGEADKHLDKLARFWGDMAVLLTYLKNQTVVGKPFLENIKNPACARMFKETLCDANKKWIRFEQVCSHYVYRCDQDHKLSIESLYGFLDGRADAMGKKQKQHMIKSIQEEFQAMYAGLEDEAEAEPSAEEQSAEQQSVEQQSAE